MSHSLFHDHDVGDQPMVGGPRTLEEAAADFTGDVSTLSHRDVNVGEKPVVEGPRRPDDTGDVESHTDVVFDAAGEPVETVVFGESPAVAIESILLSFLGGVSKSTCTRLTFVACGVVLLMGASGVAFNTFCVSFMSTIAARRTVHNPSGTPRPWARPSTEHSGQHLGPKWLRAIV